MLKTYDPNAHMNDVQTVRVTLMEWGHVGHIERKIGGNCKGLEILEEAADPDSIAEDCLNGTLTANDCSLDYDDGYDVFTVLLKDEEGVELEDTIEPDELGRYIVAVEIVGVEREAGE